ncbi:hypothetical protein Tco_1396313 [Tanacetum coccineum]
MVAWFRGLEDVRSWLLVEGNHDDITVMDNFVEELMVTDSVEELMVASVDTEKECTEVDSEQPRQVDPDIFHIAIILHLHVTHVDYDMHTTDHS